MAQITFPFGMTEQGTKAHLYLLTNARGMMVGVTDVGASLVLVRVPDAQGAIIDVCLGWGSARGYEHNEGYLGATVGRVANRVAGSSFELDGVTHNVVANEGSTSLHGGPDGWDHRLWDVTYTNEHQVTLRLLSHAGDQGYPGEVSAQVTYRLSEEGVLTIFQSALADARTPINLTNHSYWNLDGHASGSILGHTLSVDADRYLPTDEASIPTGVAELDDTVFDLRVPKRLGDCLDELPRGIDHNYCLAGIGDVRHAARLVGEHSGIALDVATDAPGIQVYMGGFLDIVRAKDGAAYPAFGGIALETQGWPDALHHPDWPSIVHEPSRPFARTTTLAFSTIEGKAQGAVVA